MNVEGVPKNDADVVPSPKLITILYLGSPPTNEQLIDAVKGCMPEIGNASIVTTGIVSFVPGKGRFNPVMLNAIECDALFPNVSFA